MSDGITEKENNSFEDYYKIDNFDDSELQARLYAEIYYDSNIEGESRTMGDQRIIQFDNMAMEMNIESDTLQHKPEMQSLTFETDGAGSQKMLSTNRTEFAEVNTSVDREMNPVVPNNKSSEDPSVTQEKENEENSSKKYKSSKHTNNEYQESSRENDNDAVYSKYNVVSKCMKKRRLLARQTDEDKDNSDSEESIFEVPVPPKPKPPLIDLQDSDEENDTNSNKDDLILKKWENVTSIKTHSKITPYKNCELEIMEIPNSCQDISSNNKNTDRACNSDAINLDKSIQTSTHVQKITEDIVLNCTTIRRGAKSVSEIKQLSRSAKTNKKNKPMEDINQNCKKQLLSNKLKENNENNLQHVFVTSGRKLEMRMQQDVDRSNVYNVCNNDIRHMSQDKTSEMECNSVIDRKRQCSNETDNYVKQKQQCTIQQNDQDISQDDNGGKKSNTSWNENLKPMPEEMRNYYNSSHNQENFDVGELQRGMSKDPQMWAILDEDLMPCPSTRQRTRFWNVRCTNCHRDGHQRYDCPLPRRTSCCYMCGMKGHTESRCLQKICLTCGKQQNTFRNTCEYCRVLYCAMCNSVGHEHNQCPDLWRRYHQTIDMSSAPQDPGNVMKPSRLLYCCNCAKRGHESSTCREYRWSEHFSTPAVVTNYTDGPIYTPCALDFNGLDSETNFSSSGTTENKISIPQNTINIQHAITGDVKLSTNVDTLLSSVNFYVPSTSQEATCISQMEGNLESSLMTNNIWSRVKTRTKLRQTQVNHVTFTSIIYSCGYFHNKNHKDIRMIMKNLSAFYTNRKSMLNNLRNREVIPGFLEILSEKAIEFEVKIGFTRRTLTLQLLAMKEYIEYLYDLLKYWLNLPDDEKDYGIDVTLPMNSIKMFNFLNSRMPQVEKMHSTRYAEPTGGMNDPQWIYNFINTEKSKLKQYKWEEKEHNRLWKKLWRLQVKLLMIVNTEHKPNFVRNFRNVMRRFELERHQMGVKLDIATYLRLILLYNQLFVPHTSEGIHSMLRRIKIQEKKNKKKSLHMQQESKITVREQENVYNVHFSSMSSCTSQNISLENSSSINNQQNKEMMVEGQNVNILLETNKTTNHNCEEVITMKDSLTQKSQIMPLNIESSVESEDPGKKDQLLTNEMKIESNVFANKQNVNMNNTVHIPLTRKEKKIKKCSNYINKINNKMYKGNIHDTALELIRKARAFQLSHMMTAADEMQRRINNRTISHKHIRTLSKLILLEEKHQKNINTYYRTLKK